MRRFVIIGSMPVQKSHVAGVRPTDYIIAADGGWRQAKKLGFTPDIIMGDFDSSEEPVGMDVPIYRTPSEKDDTDMMLCARHALEQGAGEVLILGGIGGRMDHTIANLQTLLFLAKNGADNCLLGETAAFRCMPPGEMRLQAEAGRYLSVFAMGGAATGVDLLHVKYPLAGATLTPDFPLGASNEFAPGASHATIRCRTGYLLVVTADRDGPAS